MKNWFALAVMLLYVSGTLRTLTRIVHVEEKLHRENFKAAIVSKSKNRRRRIFCCSFESFRLFCVFQGPASVPGMVDFLYFLP